MKVLIVDDNPQARVMIKHYVRGFTNEILECEDGVVALSAYREFLPDWVLMDWEMSEVNGLTATQRIISEFPDARILIVTGYDENDLRHAAREAGAVGFVLKDDLIALQFYLGIKR